MAKLPQRASLNRKEVKKRAKSTPKNSRKEKGSPPQFTPLNISYDRLLPLVRDHPEFKWPQPMRENPDQRNRLLRCDYHKDHNHELNHCQSLKFLVERLILAGHLKRFIREPTQGTETAPATYRAIIATEHPSEPRPAINFVLGGPIDDQYQSKKQRRKMLRAASVRARVNTISILENSIAVQPIDGPISFPPINPTRVITPHYDALILTLCINSFDVHRVLVDPSSAVELLHLPTFMQMKVPLNHLSSADRVLS